MVMVARAVLVNVQVTVSPGWTSTAAAEPTTTEPPAASSSSEQVRLVNSQPAGGLGSCTPQMPVGTSKVRLAVPPLVVSEKAPAVVPGRAGLERKSKVPSPPTAVFSTTMAPPWTLVKVQVMASPGAGVTATESVSRSTTAPSVPVQLMSLSAQAGSVAGRLDSVKV